MRRLTTSIRAGVAAATLLAGLGLASPVSAGGGWFSEYSGPSVNVNGAYQPLVGDFGGSVHDDIIWYAPGPATDFSWISNGDGTFTKSPLAKQITGTYVALVGDFGKDDRSDIFLYKAGSALDYLWLFQDGSITEVTHRIAGIYQPVVLRDSDFGSGNDDIFWYAPGPASDSVWTFDAAGAKTGRYLHVPGSPKPLVGDFDGNDIADVFWYNAGTTPDQLWRGVDGVGGYLFSGFNVSGTYQPTVQDYTAQTDGRSDILWFRPGTGADALWEGTGGGGFGQSSRVVPGTGLAIGLTWDWGYLWTYDPIAPDRIWYDDVATDFSQLAGNTELGGGYLPVVGNFVGFADGIFWYRSGAAPEYLMN